MLKYLLSFHLLGKPHWEMSDMSNPSAANIRELLKSSELQFQTESTPLSCEEAFVGWVGETMPFQEAMSKNAN